MERPFKKPLWSLLIISGSTRFIRFPIAFDAILLSQFKRVIGLQFFKFRKRGFLSFFGKREIIPYLWVTESCPFWKEQLIAFTKRIEMSFQKIIGEAV